MVNNKLNVNPRTMFCRDNLDIMQGINSDCIDLIYLDPPFNKKKIFSAPIGSSAEGAEFSDIFREEDIKDEWVETIKYENVPLHDYLIGVKTFSSTYNYCYLVYMAVRLIECHRILKNTGSVYLHCDPTMSHYLKIVMDCIFDEGNFKNEVVWKKYAGRKSNAKYKFPTQHECIFLYAKSEHAIFAPQYLPMTKKEIDLEYTKFDEDGRQYRLSRGRNYQLKGEQRKIYLDTRKGRMVGNLWTENGLQLNTSSKERTGYPTQKPLALLERIIKASSNEGDIVLDPFCGCATACVAAEKLQRQWIGIDVSHMAYKLVEKRLNTEVADDLFCGEPEFDTKVPTRTDKKGGVSSDLGNVYIISNKAWAGSYKVGIARDVKSRLSSYQTSDPARAYKLEYSKEVENYKDVEKYIHNKFETKHEWVVNSSVSEIKKEIKNYETKNSNNQKGL